MQSISFAKIMRQKGIKPPPLCFAGCSEAIGEKSKKQPFLRRGVEIYKDNPHELSTEPSSYRSKKNFSSFFSGKKEKKSE